MLPDDTTMTSLNQILDLKSDLKIYPSPAENFVQIDLMDIEMDSKSELIILDSKGQLVEKRMIGYFGNSNFEIDISDWISGSYYVEIKFGNRVHSGRFIKI